MLDACTTVPKVGRWTRIDWQQTWDGSTLAVEVKYFATDAESADNYLHLSSAIQAATTPDSIHVGTTAAGWKVCLDTFRTYGDVTTWPEPFAWPGTGPPRGRRSP